MADLALAELVEEDAVALVEWGDLAAPALGESALEVTLDHADAGAGAGRPTPAGWLSSVAARGRGRSAEVAAALEPVGAT